MKNMGAYENPSRITPVDTGAMSFVKALQQGQMSQQKALEEQEKIKQQKDLEQKRILERMQRVQGDADVWNLEQMNKLATSPKTNAIQDELMKTLNGRIDIATQAQIYLKTQYGDNEKRNSAKKAIQDYYDLLNLTQKTTQNLVSTGEYWRENAAKIGKEVTIIGDTEEEIAGNQFLVNALAGIYSQADFEMVYDEEKNDILIKVSGYEPKRMQDGKLTQGEYREKYLSARAWDQNVTEGQTFSFVSTVPQLVSESLERMKPADRTKDNNGLGIVGANGQFQDKYWSDPVIFRDKVKVEGSSRSRNTEEVRQYLNMDLVRQDMESILSSKIAGVTSNVQQAANGWNVDLRKLDEGIENEYQRLQPSDEEYKTALFDAIMKARTSGLVQDSQGRWYKAGNKTVIQPKVKTPKVPNIGYRASYFNNIVIGGDDNQAIVLDNMFKIEGPKGRYMSRDNIYERWLQNPNNPKISNSKTNEEFYKDKDKDPRAVFNELAPKDGLYKIINGKPVYAGDYNFDSAVGRLEFALDNTTSSERKAIENETNLMLRAVKIDWMRSNPKNTGETDDDYIKRMNKALKIK